MTDDSRARILRTSLDLFAERGYHLVSVREIAERVGLTKTAVLYHFPNKSDIVAALLEPLLTASEAVLESARRLTDAESGRWAVANGLLDVWLTHDRLLRMQIHDQALSADDETYGRLRDLALAAQEVLAGPDPDLPARVRAAQIYAALSDPVVIFAELPATEVRAAILAGVARLLESEPARVPAIPHAATSVSAPAPRRGRPTQMTPAMIESARRLRDSGGYTATEIAAELGVSRATLYRHLTATDDDAPNQPSR